MCGDEHDKQYGSAGAWSLAFLPRPNARNPNPIPRVLGFNVMTARRLYVWTFVASLLYGVIAGLLSIKLPEDVVSTFADIVILIPTVLFMASTAMVLIGIVRAGLASQRLGREKYESSVNTESSWIRKHGGHVFLASAMFFVLGLAVYVFLLVGPYL